MKTNRFFCILLTLIILVGTLVFPVTAGGNVKVVLNGTELSFDVPPQIIDGRSMVPMSVIFEVLGADVHWIDLENGFQMILAVKNEVKIFMMIDEEEFYKFAGSDIDEFLNSADELEPIALDVPPMIIDGRTLVPVRAVSEALGVDVEWDESTNTVILTCDEEFIKDKNTDETFYLKFLEFAEGEYDYDFDERIFVDIDTDADMMIISRYNEENPEKILLITNKEEIKEFLSLYKWHDYHLACCYAGSDFDYDYTISFVYGDSTGRNIYYRDEWTYIPYNEELKEPLKNYISAFKNTKAYSYKYTMAAPFEVNYETLNADLQDTENFGVYLKSSILSYPNYSFFTLTYAELDENYPDAKDWSAKYEMADNNMFDPFVEALKEEGLFVAIDKASSSVSGGGIFMRGTRVYVNKVLDDETVERYRNMWYGAQKSEPHFMSSDIIFGYGFPKTYEFIIISSQMLSEQEIASLNTKYNISLKD